MTSLDIKEKQTKRDKLNKLNHKSESNYSYLKFDYEHKTVHPYAGHYLKEFMKNAKSKTIVSTRESLHLFLND